MTKPRTRTLAHLPTTIWLPGPHDAQTSPPAPAVLPDWALNKIRTEFTHRPGRTPAPLLRLAIGDTGPGMDARTPCITEVGISRETSTRSPAKPVILTEVHPDTLPATEPNTSYGPHDQGALDDGWPGFFHRAHRLLRGNGLLLLATRQRRDSDQLTDPLGLLVASARTAGFRYLQHIVIVHGHAIGDRIVPAPPHEAPPGLIHSDLLVLRAEGSRP
ncbi:hypothetical protein LK07_24230 [Streptomyces pluripotens]|uniref:Uncharacterized protein n=1 Tax=Streptomyces pluripotens TaxID=1355015 RepID=A0A221P356_9ACTN|nr:hypothetical protein [Streptomyces pluripotens]ARP72351.1 hypothetical protein LK06_023065 [Streptomyces pluripotens]ASN26602.1 hypothetical protein LK07_24230 [Streptomyces pluripotens]